jgi:hypothetical protein
VAALDPQTKGVVRRRRLDHAPPFHWGFHSVVGRVGLIGVVIVGIVREDREAEIEDGVECCDERISSRLESIRYPLWASWRAIQR